MRSVPINRITLLTKEELAANLKVSVWTIQSYMRKGVMPKPFPLVAGGELRWRAFDIERWLDDLQTKPRKAKLRGALAKFAK